MSARANTRFAPAKILRIREPSAQDDTAGQCRALYQLAIIQQGILRIFFRSAASLSLNVAAGFGFIVASGTTVPDSRKTSHFGSLAPLKGGGAHWEHASLRVTPRSSSLLDEKISHKFTYFIDRKLVLGLI